MYFSELGYSDYDDYLVGPEWKEIKAYYYQHCKNYQCDICGVRQRILLHKRSYKFLSLPELKKRYQGDVSKILRYLHTYMVYLCSRCNKKVHFYPDGTRVELEYRKLRERETKVRRSTKKAPRVSRRPSAPQKKTLFLGSYFKHLRNR